MKDMKESEALGQHIRQLRKAKGLTLQALAAEVGCSESMLSKIENGKGNPSMRVLHNISKALGTNIGSLFAQDSAPELVSRKGQRHLAQLVSGKGVILEYLSPHQPGHQLQAHIHIIEPGGSSLEAIAHEGEEVGYVLEGEVELSVDGEQFLLLEGDSFFFESSLPHAFHNKGATTARVIWVNTPPTY
jgi:transcriptional regulator with XRE-family HTH domain